MTAKRVFQYPGKEKESFSFTLLTDRGYNRFAFTGSLDPFFDNFPGTFKKTILFRESDLKNERGKRIDYSFGEELKQGVYDAIYKRRDIRRFLSEPIPEEVLIKILEAGHQAGSVGLMQPWNFIVVDDPGIKVEVKRSFLKSNTDAAALYSGEKLELYQQLKLEGIEEAPINIAVTCDYSRKGPHVLGTRTMSRTPLFSACCAIQNIWLAARAEGIGMGWVSILDPKEVKESLKIPESVELVAYLCMGYVEIFPDRPVLEEAGWEEKEPLEKFVYRNGWNRKI